MSKYTFYKKVFFSSFFILLFSHLIVAQTTLYSIGTSSESSPANNSNWSYTSGGAPANITPNANHTLVFDSNSVSCFLNGALAVASIVLDSTYNDTVRVLSNTSNFTITNLLNLKSGCFVFNNNPVFLNGGISVSPNATFVSSQNTMRLMGQVNNKGNWIHNSGKVLAFNSNFKGNLSLNNLEISQGFILVDTNVVVNTFGNLEILSLGGINFNGPGEIHLHGNLINRNVISAGGTGKICFKGTADQTLFGNNRLTVGWLPQLIIDKSSGTLFLKDTICITNPIRKINGTLDASTFNSTVAFFLNSITLKESLPLHHVVFTPNNTALNLDSNVVLQVNGNMTVNANGGTSQSFNGPGEIHLKGNLTNRNIGSASGGNGMIRFIGDGEQILSGNNKLTVGGLPTLIIDKPSGTLFLKDTICLVRPIRKLNGFVDASTFNSTVAFFLNSITLKESLPLHHVVFTANNTALNIDTNVALQISGNMSINTNGSVSQSFNGPGEIHLKGNLTNRNVGSASGGNGMIRFIGDGEQILSGNNRLTVGGLPQLVIDKLSGTLFLKDTICLVRPIRKLNGLVDASTYNSTVGFFGNITLKESLPLHHLVFTPLNTALNLDSNVVLQANGNMTVNANGTTSQSFNGPGEIQLKGNLTNMSIGSSTGGNGTIVFNGEGNQQYDGLLSSTNGRLPNIIIRKNEEVFFKGNLSLNGNFIVEQGSGKFVDSLGFLNLFGANSSVCNQKGSHFVEINNIKLFANTQLAGDVKVKRQLDIGSFHLKLNNYELKNENVNSSSLVRTSAGSFLTDSLFSGRYSQRCALNSNYTIPFRNSNQTTITPVTFRLDSATTTDSTYFTIASYGTNPSLSPNNRPLPSGLQALMDTSQQEASQFVVDRYWKCNVDNVSNFAKATLGVSFLTTESGSPNIISPLSSLKAYSYGGNNQFTSLNTTGTITATLTTINLVKPDNDCIILSTKQVDRGETTPESIWSGFGCNSDSSLCANIYTIPGARNSFQSSVFVNIEQGQSPFSYLWSNNTTNPNLENYAVGEYRVTVTDANNRKGILTTFAGHKLGWDSLFNLSEYNNFGLQVGGGIAINAGDTTADVSVNGLAFSKNVLKRGENGNLLFEIEKGAEFSGLMGYSTSLTGFMNGGIGFGLAVIPKENWDGLGGASQELHFMGGEVSAFLGEVQDSLALSLRIKKVSDSLFLYKNGVLVYSFGVSDFDYGNENFQLPDISPLVICISPNAKIKQMSCDFGERIENAQALITHCTNTSTGIVLGNISFDYDSSATYIWSNGATSSSIDSLSPGEYTCTVINNSDTLINSYSVGYYATWDTLIGVELQDKGGLQATSAISGQGFDGYGFSLNALQPQEDGWAQFTIPAGNSFSGMFALTSVKDFDGEGQSTIIGIIENDILILCTGCSDAISFGNYDSTKSYTFYFSVEGNEVFIVKKVEDDFGSAFFAQKAQISRDENFTLGFVPFNSNSRVSEIVSSFGTVLKATVTPIPGEKNSGKGSLSINAKGGVLPYIYNWSNGATSSSITDAPLGDYHVTVTDANDKNVVLKSFNGQYASWDTFIRMNENPDYSLSFDTLSGDSTAQDFVLASSSNRILENQNGNVSFEFDKGLDFVGSIVGLFTSGSLLNEGDGCAVIAQPVENLDGFGPKYSMYFISTWSEDFVYIGNVPENLPMSIRFKVVNGDILVYKNGIQVYRASSSQTNPSTIQLPSLSPFITVIERKNVKIGRVLVDFGTSNSLPLAIENMWVKDVNDNELGAVNIQMQESGGFPPFKFEYSFDSIYYSLIEDTTGLSELLGDSASIDFDLTSSIQNSGLRTGLLPGNYSVRISDSKGTEINETFRIGTNINLFHSSNTQLIKTDPHTYSETFVSALIEFKNISNLKKNDYDFDNPESIANYQSTYQSVKENMAKSIQEIPNNFSILKLTEIDSSLLLNVGILAGQDEVGDSSDIEFTFLPSTVYGADSNKNGLLIGLSKFENQYIPNFDSLMQIDSFDIVMDIVKRNKGVYIAYNNGYIYTFINDGYSISSESIQLSADIPYQIRPIRLITKGKAIYIYDRETRVFEADFGSSLPTTYRLGALSNNINMAILRFAKF